MNKIKPLLYKTTCAVMIFFFGCIFLQTTVNLSHMELMQTFLGGIRTPLFLISGAALLLLIFCGLTKYLCRLSAGRRKIVLASMAAAGIALQLLLIFGLRPCLQYDALKPVDTAVAMMNGTPLAATPYYSYFSIYPHNVPLTLYIMLVLKAADLFGIAAENYIVVLQLLNCVLFNIALVQIYALLKRHFGIQKSTGFALLCLLNPLVYYYPVFFYTQALSIPLFALLLTVFHKILDAKTVKSRVIYGALYGIILFFAWKIRFFTLITLIACAMFLFFRKTGRKMNAKAVAAVLAAAAVTFSGCLIAHSLLMEKYSVHTEESLAFPIQHWIMMGLQGDGTFFYMDEDFTAALPSKDIRAEENTKIIQQRLAELGPVGLLKLWGRKLNVTWSDGYDDYAANLTLIKQHNALTDLLCGWRSEYIAAYLHMYNCMSWLLLLLCAAALFKKGAADAGYTICITIVGGIVFHLIWEAGEPYSMPFALLMIAGASIGSDMFFRPSFEGMLQKRKFRRGLLLIPAASLVWGICLVPQLLSSRFDVTEISAIQNLVGGDYIYLEEGDTLTQTIQTTRAFDRITLRYKYYDETAGEALATMRFFDSDGNCLSEQTMPLENIVTITEFPLPATAPDGEETYTVELTAAKIPDGSRIGVTAYNTGNWDTFQKGEALLNGSALKNSDIYFELMNSCIGDRTML